MEEVLVLEMVAAEEWAAVVGSGGSGGVDGGVRWVVVAGCR